MNDSKLRSVNGGGVNGIDGWDDTYEQFSLLSNGANKKQGLCPAFVNDLVIFNSRLVLALQGGYFFLMFFMISFTAVKAIASN